MNIPLDYESPENEVLAPSFWQKSWGQNVLPFVTSLVLHGGVIVLGLVAATVVPIVVIKVFQENMIVSDIVLSDGDAGGIPHPGLGGDPTYDGARDNEPTISRCSDGLSDMKGLQTTESDYGDGSSSDAFSSTIGIRISGGPGSDLAPFGLPGGGGGIGPRCSFIGCGGNATSVAFVCDASGSMLGQQFDLLKGEIGTTVDKLKPIQAFDVIFFKKQGFDALSLKGNGRLLIGNSQNKSLARTFLKDVETGPDSDPVPALRHAFSMKPQLIYLLTDGAFADNQEVLAKVRAMNAGKKIKINTIAFFRPNIEPGDKKLCEEVLSTIARENGGRFRMVNTTELLRGK